MFIVVGIAVTVGRLFNLEVSSEKVASSGSGPIRTRTCFRVVRFRPRLYIVRLRSSPLVRRTSEREEGAIGAVSVRWRKKPLRAEPVDSAWYRSRPRDVQEAESASCC